MQRPPIACRRAAHSFNSPAQNYIWISDELLTRTLHRFFRGGCAHQKRHGSQVPGPLEARRRAVKRRMTVQSHIPPGYPPPPLFNFGALFGGRPNPQSSWRYEPPSMPRPAEPLNFSLITPVPPSPVDFDDHPSSHDNPASVYPPQTPSSTEIAPPPPSESQDSTINSREPLDPKTQNGRGKAPQGLAKSEFGKMRTQSDQITKENVHIRTPQNKLEPQWKKSRAPVKLGQSQNAMNFQDQPAIYEHTTPIQPSSIRNEKRLNARSDSGPQDTVKMLLRGISRDGCTKHIAPAKIEAFVRSYPLEGANVRLVEAMANLLLHLHKNSIPNHGVANMVVDIVGANKSPERIFQIMKRLQEKGGSLSSTDFLHDFLFHQTQRAEEGQKASRTAHTVALQVSELIRTFETNPHLPRMGPAQASGDSPEARVQFRHILNRAREAYVLPLAYRNASLDLLMDKRAGIIHQLAYQYSLDHTRSSRQNWRSINYLYNYLKRYKLLISPLMSRAMVTVGLAQPMSKHEFIDSRRLVYICRMVAEVEGEDVARKIEWTFWNWRGELIHNAKERLTSLGGTGKAHVNTMKKLGTL